MLPEQGALEELPALQPRAQNEVTLVERVGFPKARRQIFLHYSSLPNRR
jgi:hypothetical protein